MGETILSVEAVHQIMCHSSRIDGWIWTLHLMDMMEMDMIHGPVISRCIAQFERCLLQNLSRNN